MKEVKAKPFKNKITISGEVYKKDDYTNYIPIPLAGFDIKSFRNKTDENGELIFDDIRIIRFNDEEILDKLEIGNRVLISGEIQSRNFTSQHPITDDMLQSAVDLYTEFFADDEHKLPAEKQPNSRIRQPISWELLFKHSLIEDIPKDSIIREDGKREKTEEQLYLYRIDYNGEIYKESENTAYEVIAHEITFLEDEVDPEIGDENYVICHGRVSRAPSLDVIEGSQFSKLTVQSYVNYFLPDEKRYAFINFFAWGNNAEILFSELEEGEMVRFTGRMQSRAYTKTLKFKKKTASGKTRRKKVEIIEITREVSIEKMTKIAQKNVH